MRRKQFPAWLIALLAVSGMVVFMFVKQRPPPGDLSPSQMERVQKVAAEVAALEAQENQIEETIWAKEKLAQQCGLVFDTFWDTLNKVTNKLEILGLFSLGELIPPRLDSPRHLTHGIGTREPLGPAPSWSPDVWRKFFSERQRDGWQLVQTEFRQNRFDADSTGWPQRSHFFCSGHLTNSLRPERAIVEGTLTVDWNAPSAPDTLPTIKRIDASQLALKTRRGEPACQRVFYEEFLPPPKSFFVDPLILYDLDGDGLSEIILAAKNLVLRRRSGDRFESELLCKHSPGLIFTGVIADFDADGAADFLCAKFEGLYLFKGSPQGTFDQPGQPVWQIDPHLKYGQVLTCGDIDQDGDLDVWLGQYKVPYERGQMPSPYYDANDGNPSYLLRNDGQGNFSDATETAGLGKKRWRRSYSGSLIDFDGDGDLDLLVVSDFAGLDVYTNDGRGHFSDATPQWVDEPHSFGMAHAFADFNADGRLDLLMIGMNSPTADRLSHLGLERPGHAKFQSMRPLMTYGNRLYLRQTNAPFFQQTPLNSSIARSGWSWGCAAFDFDNDGFTDVYIANGHTTQKTVREYEPQFWLHDLYVGNSKPNDVANVYFGSKFSRTRAAELSYGGYEKNRLYLNQRAESFVEIAHLMGVALEQDSRNAVADDLDGDGRMDLLVTSFEVWPQVKQPLHIFKNTIENNGNWIGVRLREEGGGISPVGARVTVHYAHGIRTQPIVTGDSFRAQHANTVHFGLGNIRQVDKLEVRWMNGQTVALEHPAINQYHAVSATSRAKD